MQLLKIPHLVALKSLPQLLFIQGWVKFLRDYAACRCMGSILPRISSIEQSSSKPQPLRTVPTCSHPYLPLSSSNLEYIVYRYQISYTLPKTQYSSVDLAQLLLISLSLRLPTPPSSSAQQHSGFVVCISCFAGLLLGTAMFIHIPRWRSEVQTVPVGKKGSEWGVRCCG